MNIFERLDFSETHLTKVRSSLYHSDNEGFYIYKDFLQKDETAHLRNIWLREQIKELFPLRDTNKPIKFGMENFSCGGRAQITRYNFPWNPVIDQFSTTLSFAIAQYKNMIRATKLYSDINYYPKLKQQEMHTFRFVNTRSGSPVQMHRDYIKEHNYGPDRIQATLFLSNYGQDWQSGGFLFRKNNDQLVLMGEDVPLAAGDLILWRHHNEHGVQNVESSTEQTGFSRMLFLDEVVVHD